MYPRVITPFGLLEKGLRTTGATVEVGTPANPLTVDKFGGTSSEINGFEDFFGRNFGQPFYEQALNVVVGENSFGEVDVSGGAILRNQNVVLGGSPTDIGAETVDSQRTQNGDRVLNPDFLTGSTSGAGRLVLRGTGTNFNNHPQVIPTVFQDPDNPFDTRFNVPDAWNFANIEEFEPGTIKRDINPGYDVYVGLTGSGQFDVIDGARA